MGKIVLIETDSGKCKELGFINLRTDHDPFARSGVIRFRDHGSSQEPAGRGLWFDFPWVSRSLNGLRNGSPATVIRSDSFASAIFIRIVIAIVPSLMECTLNSG